MRRNRSWLIWGHFKNSGRPSLNTIVWLSFLRWICCNLVYLERDRLNRILMRVSFYLSLCNYLFIVEVTWGVVDLNELVLRDIFCLFLGQWKVRLGTFAVYHSLWGSWNCCFLWWLIKGFPVCKHFQHLCLLFHTRTVLEEVARKLYVCCLLCDIILAVVENVKSRYLPLEELHRTFKREPVTMED